MGGGSGTLSICERYLLPINISTIGGYHNSDLNKYDYSPCPILSPGLDVVGRGLFLCLCEADFFPLCFSVVASRKLNERGSFSMISINLAETANQLEPSFSLTRQLVLRSTLI